MRLLKSGTVTQRAWFDGLAADVDHPQHEGANRPWEGPRGRLRPFGFVAVRESECARGAGLPAIGASAAAALIAVRRLGSVRT